MVSNKGTLSFKKNTTFIFVLFYIRNCKLKMFQDSKYTDWKYLQTSIEEYNVEGGEELVLGTFYKKYS